MLRRCLLPLLLLAFWPGTMASAETPPACASAEARQFDFWVGEWEIAQKILAADGTWVELPAHTSVKKVLEGCALLEQWQGKVQFFWIGHQQPVPLAGLSVRAYDPRSGKWRIHWMDTENPRFGVFEGGFEEGRGEFFQQNQAADGSQRLSRITFSDIGKDSVRWELATSRDAGKTWNVIWVMEMKRETPQ